MGFFFYFSFLFLLLVGAGGGEGWGEEGERRKFGLSEFFGSYGSWLIIEEVG